MVYYPDKWMVIRINDGLYKVFASFYGGFAGGDSWKINSGITKVVDLGTAIEFLGSSGSSYVCDKMNYGAHMYGSGVLNQLIKDAEEAGTKVTIMDEDTEWTTLLKT